jgi:hypothetical protein
MSFEAQGEPELPVSFLATAGTAAPRPYHGLGGAHGAALLEAFAAEDWAALGRAEGYRRVLTALGAGGFGLGTHLHSATTVGADAFRALSLATFATFGFVFEALVGEEHLFAGSKDKLRTTFGTLQDLIVEFHEPLPLAQFEQGGKAHLAPQGRVQDSAIRGEPGTASMGPEGTSCNANPTSLLDLGLHHGSAALGLERGGE